MEQIISPPTSRVAWLTPDDQKPREQNNGRRPSKAKSAEAHTQAAPNSKADHLDELTVPEAKEKHQLDELA